MAEMEAAQRLETVLLQITNGGAECEIYLVAGNSKHRVSTALLAPLMDQLDSIREQYSSDTIEIVLEPRTSADSAVQSPGRWKGSIFKWSRADKKKGQAGKGSSVSTEGPAWFTRATAEKAFHLLSSLELLELPARLARDLAKVHEKAKVAEPYERASLETSQRTLEREFGKAMLVANCAGYHPGEMGSVKSFAEEFKGRRLWAACQAFETECSVALSRLPPPAAKEAEAPSDRWPPNELPLLDGANFNNNASEDVGNDTVDVQKKEAVPADESSAKAPITELGGAGEARAVEIGEEHSPATIPTTPNVTGIGATKGSGVADEPGVSEGAGRGMENRHPSIPRTGTARNDAQIMTDNLLKGDDGEGPEEVKRLQSILRENAGPAPQEKRQEPVKQVRFVSAEEFVPPAPVVDNPLKGPELKAGEPVKVTEGTRAGARDLHEHRLSPSLPALDSPVEGPALSAPNVAMAHKEPALASTEQTTKSEAVSQVRRSGDSIAPGSGSTAAPDKAEPTISPSSFASESPHVRSENPLSWSDPEDMKLARDSYGLQSMSAMEVAPVTSLVTDGALGSSGFASGSAVGSDQTVSPSAGSSGGAESASGEVRENRNAERALVEAPGMVGAKLEQKLEHPVERETRGVPEHGVPEVAVVQQAEKAGHVPISQGQLVHKRVTFAPSGVDQVLQATEEKPGKLFVKDKGEVVSDVSKTESTLASENQGGGVVLDSVAQPVSAGKEVLAPRVSEPLSAKEWGKKIGSVELEPFKFSDAQPELHEGALAVVAGSKGLASISSDAFSSKPSDKPVRATPETLPVATSLPEREGTAAPAPIGKLPVRLEESPAANSTNNKEAGPTPLKPAPPSDRLLKQTEPTEFLEEKPAVDVETASLETPVPPAPSPPAAETHHKTESTPTAEPEVKSSPETKGPEARKADDQITEPSPSLLESSNAGVLPPAEPTPTPTTARPRSYDKPWLGPTAVAASRSPKEGPEAQGLGGGRKEGERRTSGGRRDSMATYKERRQAKMKEQEERIRGEHEAKLKALEDALEKRKAEMAERSRRSALLSAAAADRRAALEIGAAGAAPEMTGEEAKQRARERLRKVQRNSGAVGSDSPPTAGAKVANLLVKVGGMVDSNRTGQSPRAGDGGLGSKRQFWGGGQESLQNLAPSSSLEKNGERRSSSRPKSRGQQSPRGNPPSTSTERSQSTPRRRSPGGQPGNRDSGGESTWQSSPSWPALGKLKDEEPVAKGTGGNLMNRSVSPGRGSIVLTPQAPNRKPSPSRASPSALAPGYISPGRASLANTPKSSSSPYPSPRGPLAGRMSPNPRGWSKLPSPRPSSTAGDQTAGIATPPSAKRSMSAPSKRSPEAQQKGAPRPTSPGTFGRAPRSTSLGTFGGTTRLALPGTLKAPLSGSNTKGGGVNKDRRGNSKIPGPPNTSSAKRRIELLPENKVPVGGGIKPTGGASGATSKGASKPSWESGVRITVVDPQPRDRFGNRTALPPTPRNSGPGRSASAAVGPKRRSSLPGSIRSVSTPGTNAPAAKGAQTVKRASGPGGPLLPGPSGGPLRRGRHSIGGPPQAPNPAPSSRRSSGTFGAPTNTQNILKGQGGSGTAGLGPRSSKAPAYTMSAKNRLLSQTKASQAKVADKPVSEASVTRRLERKSLPGPIQGAVALSGAGGVRPARRASSASGGDAPFSGKEGSASRKENVPAAQPALERPTFAGKPPAKASENGLTGSVDEASGESRQPEEKSHLERAHSAEQMFGKEIVLDEEQKDVRDGAGANGEDAYSRQQKLLALLQARQQSSLAANGGLIQLEGQKVEQPGKSGVQSGGSEEIVQLAEVEKPVIDSGGANEAEGVLSQVSPALKQRKRWEEPEPLAMAKSPESSTFIKLGKLFSRKASKWAEGAASPVK